MTPEDIARWVDRIPLPRSDAELIDRLSSTIRVVRAELGPGDAAELTHALGVIWEGRVDWQTVLERAARGWAP
jgi:hypothetical protein